MAEAKLAPNLPDWIVEHVNRCLASGGTDGHMYKVTVPQRGEITAPALLLTTTAASLEISSYFRCFTARTAAVTSSSPQREARPNTQGGIEIFSRTRTSKYKSGAKKMNARARTTAGEERLRLWKKALEFWPPYADYQLNTEREIPVVVLDPVHSATWRPAAAATA